jgi:katanin p80 WD40 repeat-containing subunit B1
VPFFFFFWFLYGANSTHDQNDCTEQKTNLNSQGSHSSEKVGSGIRSTLDLRRMSPDYETKEIKNIYVDCKLLPFFLTSF